MSSRAFKIFGKTLSDGVFNVLIHSTYNDKFLCIKSNALMTLGSFFFIFLLFLSYR